MTFSWKTNPEENKHLCVCHRKRRFGLQFMLENKMVMQVLQAFLSMNVPAVYLGSRMGYFMFL